MKLVGTSITLYRRCLSEIEDECRREGVSIEYPEYDSLRAGGVIMAGGVFLCTSVDFNDDKYDAAGFDPDYELVGEEYESFMDEKYGAAAIFVKDFYTNPIYGECGPIK